MENASIDNETNSYGWWTFAALILSTVGLLILINQMILDPVSALQDAGTPNFDAVVKAAGWGAFFAAAGVAVGTLLGLANGRIGAVGKGLNAGACVAVMAAAGLVALASQGS